MVATPEQPQNLPPRLQVNPLGSSASSSESEEKLNSLGNGLSNNIPPTNPVNSSRPLFAVSENPTVSRPQDRSGPTNHEVGSSGFNPRRSAFQSLADSESQPSKNLGSSSSAPNPQVQPTGEQPRASRLTDGETFSGTYIGSRVEPVGKRSYGETRQARRYREEANKQTPENTGDDLYTELLAGRQYDPLKRATPEAGMPPAGRHSAPNQKPTPTVPAFEKPRPEAVPSVEETLSIGRQTFESLRSPYSPSSGEGATPTTNAAPPVFEQQPEPAMPEKAPLGEPLMVSPLSLSEERALMPEEPTAPDGAQLVPTALDQSILANPVMPAPKTGWRKLVHTLTGGHVNLGDPERIVHQQQLIKQVRSPLRGDYRVAVLSLKGGVGKTTTSVMLGGIFASLRGDRVIAIDANPDLGTLAQRAALPGSPTIRDLLNADDVSRYSLIRNYTTQAESRLEVIGSERDPEVSEAFSERDYRHAIDILQHHYNIILTDCGTGLMHSAMAGVLDLANTLVVVTSTALDGAQSASATLDWLNHHGYEQLVSNAVVVVSAARPGPPNVNVQQLMDHFRARTRAVAMIPFDRHLSEGAMIDLERLDRKTYLAYLELAGLVAQDFPNWHRHAFKDQSPE